MNQQTHTRKSSFRIIIFVVALVFANSENHDNWYKNFIKSIITSLIVIEICAKICMIPKKDSVKLPEGNILNLTETTSYI